MPLKNSPSAQHWISWEKILPGLEIIVERERRQPESAHLSEHRVIWHTAQHYCYLNDVKCSSENLSAPSNKLPDSFNAIQLSKKVIIYIAYFCVWSPSSFIRLLGKMLLPLGLLTLFYSVQCIWVPADWALPNVLSLKLRKSFVLLRQKKFHQKSCWSSLLASAQQSPFSCPSAFLWKWFARIPLLLSKREAMSRTGNTPILSGLLLCTLVLLCNLWPLCLHTRRG